MARRISNRISVSSIDDGTTIHGSLRATKALSQGYGQGRFVPDWSVDANRPTIYLTLLNGTTAILPKGEVEWYWNTLLLTFDENGYSTNAKNGDKPLFQKTVQLWEGVNMPALKIIENMAIVGSLNNDIVELRGNVEIAGELVPFSSGVEIQLVELHDQGYLGVINFVGGKSTLSSDSDSVEAYGELYAVGEVTGWKAEWLFNGEAAPSSMVSTKHGNTNDTITVTGNDDSGVVDIATITCVFKVKETNSDAWTQAAIATATIDDISDEEYMYVYFTINGSSSQNNGSPVSLRSGQSVTWDMFVAKQDDATAINTTYKNFYFQPRDARGVLFTGVSSLSGKTPDASGFYKINSSTANHGSIVITHDDAKAAKGNVNGILLATD